MVNKVLKKKLPRFIFIQRHLLMLHFNYVGLSKNEFHMCGVRKEEASTKKTKYIFVLIQTLVVLTELSKTPKLRDIESKTVNTMPIFL